MLSHGPWALTEHQIPTRPARTSQFSNNAWQIPPSAAPAAQRMPENINFTAQTVLFFSMVCSRRILVQLEVGQICAWKPAVRNYKLDLSSLGLFLSRAPSAPVPEQPSSRRGGNPSQASFLLQGTAVSKHLSWIQASCIRFTFFVCFENWRLHRYMKFKN